MSLVTLYSGNAERSGEVQASRTWRIPAAGEAGQASITIPYTSSLADLVDMQAGMTVLVHDADGCGSWWGIVVDADWNEGGIVLMAQQIWMILGRRFVSLSGVRMAAQPGKLVTEALRNSGQVLGMTLPDAPFGGDSPPIAFWEWDNRDVWSVITEQMGRSGNEFWVDPDTREMSWIGPLASDLYEPLLIAGQSLRGWALRESNADRVSEVFGVYSALTQTTTYGTFTPAGLWRASVSYGENAVAGWPVQATVAADSPSGLRDVAQAELSQRAMPALSIGGALSRDHIAIRERNYANIFIPRKGLTYQCRVMARTVDDAADDIGVELLAMPSNTVTTTVKAPGWVSRDIGRGTGSIGQRIVRHNRRLGRTR